ncbi:MAG: citrate/2-methylcitrate synthase, partial [Planctomycetaceae bacterium]
MADTEATILPKPKKSVALSGVPAGNTALCTVGRSGNDLHYRGYDILDFAATAEFEEVAYLLIHEKLPNKTELINYKAKLKSLRSLPAAVKAALECLPAAAHPMDVLRTGCSTLGCVLPEKDDHPLAGARDIADRLMASFGSMLLYWYHFSQHGRRIEVETDDNSIGAHFLTLLHGQPCSSEWERAMHTSLILYAEHEFNASTFTCRVIAGTGSDMYSAITGGIGALRGPKHGGANEFAYEILSRYSTPDEAEADIIRRIGNKEIVIGFGHPVYTTGDPRNKVIKEVARKLSDHHGNRQLFD